MYCPCFKPWTTVHVFFIFHPLDDFPKFLYFPSKLQVISHLSFFWISNFLLHFILPAFFFQNSSIFSQVLFQFSMFSSLMASSQLDSVFPEGHISYEVRQGLPEHRVLSTGSFFPRWYYSWFKNFSRMFPDHLDDCGLELASAVGKQTVNGNLIHALAERWNPSTSTFWFPWGEMTVADRWIFRNYGITRASRSAWRSIGETVFD